MFNTLAMPANVARAWLHARGSEAIVIHNGRFKAIPPHVVVPLFCHAIRNALILPSNLTLLLVHNRPYKTLMEQSLEYVGIQNYTTLRVPNDRPWRQSFKITAILDYLKSGQCRTEYVLFCDADDAILRNDPAGAVELLHAANCDMLVSSTRYARYHGLIRAQAWAKSIAPVKVKEGSRRVHLNSGVYVARTEFLMNFMEQAGAFVTNNDIAGDVFHALNDSEVVVALPNLPLGSGDDQLIFRFLHERNFPQMKVDYESRLALR